MYPFSQHLPGASFEYAPAVAGQTFTERFNEATANLSETELAVTLGLSVSAVRKLRAGDQQMLKLDAGLRLCDKLGVDPWYLAFGRTRPVGVPVAEPSAVSALGEARKELQSLQDEVQALTDAQMKRDQQLTELLVSQERLAAAQQERDRQIAGLESTIERLANLVEHLQTPQ